MMEKLKSMGSMSLGILGFLAMLAIPFLFFKGAIWASEHLLNSLFAVAWVVLFLDALILLPLSLVRRFRPHTGGLIYLSSYLFGLLTWLFGFIVTYALWGGVAVVIGLMFFGVGVVFMAILASTFKAMWEMLATVIVLAIITYGSRLVGMKISAAQPEP